MVVESNLAMWILLGFLSVKIIYLLDDIKKLAILKNGIGIEGQKSTQTS